MPWMYLTGAWSHVPVPAGPGRPHRDRRQINARRRAARRNRRKR